LLFFISINST